MRAPIIGRLGLGTAQFGPPYGVSNRIGQVPYSEAAAIIKVAGDAGMTMIDTAPTYGDAEEMLGHAIPPGATLHITTKTLSLSQGLSAVLDRFRRSLEFLRVSSIDTLLVHAATDLSSPDGPNLWRALQKLRESKLCQRIGFSAYFEDEPLSLAQRFAEVDVVQLPLSFLDQRLLVNGTIGQLKSMGILLQARSIFLQGAIFLGEQTLVERFGHAGSQLSRLFARILRDGATPMSAALGFVLARPEIDVAIIGVTCAAELDEIAKQAVSAPLDMRWDSFAVNDPFVLSPFLWTSKASARSR